MAPAALARLHEQLRGVRGRAAPPRLGDLPRRRRPHPRGADCFAETQPPQGAFTRVSAYSYGTCGQQAVATVTCWGRSVEGIAPPPAGRSFAVLAAGGSTVCGLSSADELSCWGRNTSGERDPPGGVHPSRGRRDARMRRDRRRSDRLLVQKQRWPDGCPFRHVQAGASATTRRRTRSRRSSSAIRTPWSSRSRRANHRWRRSPNTRRSRR